MLDPRPARRDFLRTIGAGLAACGSWRAIEAALPAAAEDAAVSPAMVSLRPELEPIVRWIESTPRAKILEKAAEELRKGLSYRQLLAGTFLAGIRNIRPRPVGFKFHAVMVVESAHQLGLDLPQGERLLPLFWALDNFKSSQARDVEEGDWALAPVKESSVPGPDRAKALFMEAMERWDMEAADVAIAGLCRGAGEGDVAETLWRYGVRDWQNIGHKAIFTAHAVRTLHTIGWEHAEPVLRSLVYGLLSSGKTDAAATYEGNLELAGMARPDWPAGKLDPAASVALLEALRTAKPDEAARAALDALNGGAAPQALWDGVLLASAELLLKRPGIVALHAWTASNALHHTYLAAASPATRVLALLQACSWVALFREGVRERSGLPDGPRIDKLEADESGKARGLDGLFQDLAKDRPAAARQTLALVGTGEAQRAFVDVARRLAMAKGTDAHDYKLAAAVIEEAGRASEAWRPRLLAASTMLLRGASDADSPLLEKSRRAVAGA
jgi:hypothetical protein